MCAAARASCLATGRSRLLDKVGYYLKHEEERVEFARRGYEWTRAEHIYDRRIAEMIRVVNGTI